MRIRATLRMRLTLMLMISLSARRAVSAFGVLRAAPAAVPTGTTKAGLRDVPVASPASATELPFRQRRRPHTAGTTSTQLNARNRGGLEQRREGATPAEGGMTLYVKAGPDGTSLGDCPFAHYVRLVLEAKKLDYELVPAVQDTKPGWLIEHYEGKMPALRHRKECYVESDTIAAYLDFFFPQPELTAPDDDDVAAAVAAVDGLFPAMAQYLKHTPDGDEVDAEKRDNLKSKLAALDAHLSKDSRTGPYLVGDGSVLRLNDCKLAPVLYHMTTGLTGFKANAIDVANEFPSVQKYMDHMFATSEFQKTVYPAATVEWGWGNARS